MKKSFFLLVLLMIVLSACTVNNSQERADVKSEMEPLFSEIKSLFEEAENRSFDLSFPIKIEEEDCYQIVVIGKLKSDRTYPIDTIAVNQNGDKRYFLNKETGTYERYYTTPTFACKTSPDGKLRIESVGMYEDGPSGLHILKEMRMINTSTGDVLWSASGNLANEFLWSEDGRFVAAGYAGRQWRQTDIVDTEDYSVIRLPQIEDILKAAPNTSQPNDHVSLPTFKAAGWAGPSIICIQFQWMTSDGTVVSGEYEYDIINNKMNMKEIKEESAG